MFELEIQSRHSLYVSDIVTFAVVWLRYVSLWSPIICPSDRAIFLLLTHLLLTLLKARANLVKGLPSNCPVAVSSFAFG
jgi:hypothetical protein